VVGEFYWRVSRGQKTYNREFVSGKSVLSKEQSANEVTWSAGSTIDSFAVTQAFKLQAKQDLFKREDAGPLSSGRNPLMKADFWVFVLVVLVFLVMSRCSSDCDPNVENCTSSNYRSSGGSYGGFSSGGGHK